MPRGAIREEGLPSQEEAHKSSSRMHSCVRLGSGPFQRETYHFICYQTDQLQLWAELQKQV